MKNILLILTVAIIAGCTNLEILKPTESSTRKSKPITQARFPSPGKLISVKALQDNLTELNYRLDSVHPNPNFTMNLADVRRQIKSLSESVTSPMSHYEAWKYLSQLNPYFQDGHMLISSAELDAQYNNHSTNGGRLFPIKVTIDESQRIFVADTPKDNPEIKIGDEIISINGEPAANVVHAILSRMHGDTLQLRIALAANRFAKMYWLLFGDTGDYQIEIQQEYGKNLYSVLGQKDTTHSSNGEIGNFVQRQILDNGIGYLRIDRFYYSQDQEQDFFNFMQHTWQEFNQAHVTDVIIDVRTNPGGTDHYWQQGIAPYVASEPFLFLSKFKIRMTERNIRLGPIQGELGELVEGAFNQLVPVDGHNNLRIPGQAYLLMGPLSYSSTVLFLTSLQDSKQALIAGHASARSCTTGRIETVALSGSNLELTLPTAIFTRPSGNEQCQQPITPDVFISNEAINSNRAVTELSKFIVASRKTNKVLRTKK